VTVTPAAEQVRVGEPVKATIKAWYYFGSPAVAAQVKYRIFRVPYEPSFRFPRPYDWLTRRWMGDQPYYGRGEVVGEGEGQTDEKGELPLEVRTEGDGEYPDAKAYRYTIEAQVTDESRRTITGTGEVRASTQQFFAFLDVKRGFYLVGDRVEVEVATRDVMDRPVAAKGRMRVERVITGAGPADIVEALVYEEPVATDEFGRAFFRWTCTKAGQYRFAFRAVDGWNQTVEGYAYTYVAGPGFDTAAIRLSGIELVPEKRAYDEGDTCRLLVVSSMPHVTVLLTQEAGRQILSRAVLPVEGKSRLVEVKLNKGHAPNFSFRAIVVRNWKAHEAETEVFVPPGKQFLDVSVSSDRAQYRPGEKATFTVRAADWQGKPVRAEFSLGVIDKSLLYIQQDFAPDPRLFYYGDRRDLCLPRQWSFQWTPQPVSRTDRQRRKYSRHEWAWPDDMGRLQDWPPDRIEDWASYRGLFPFGIQPPEGPAPTSFDAVTAAAPILGPVPKEPLARHAAAGAPGAGIPPAAAGAFRAALRGGRGGYSGQAAASQETPPGALAAAAVRTRFADTAAWSPSVVTGADGTASVTVTMPENLTAWQAAARAVTMDAQVGEGFAECVTRKNVIVRLQAPRFFMERDLVALSANVHNYLPTGKQAKVSLSVDGGTLELVRDVPADLGLSEPATEPEVTVRVHSNGVRRVDWVVRATRPGLASVTVTAQTDEESDAMRMEFPVLVHGVEKLQVQSGVVRDAKGERTAALTLNLPAERRRGATELNLQLTPSLAAIAIDALPYLVDYPYGCVEQTMSRFLPTVLVARTLADLGVDLKAVRKRAEAYAADAQSKGASQPHSAYTYPKGMPGSVNAAELASRMYLRRAHSPVFDREELAKMVRVGLARIYSQQRDDGGWGWWPEDGADPYMTAYVCYGLYAAREAGWDIDDSALERGFQFLSRALKDDGNLHRAAYLASVVTLRGSLDPAASAVITDRLYPNRLKLTPYSQALLALALKNLGDIDKARVLVDNLENTARIDRASGTCSWASGDGRWWHWWENPVETSAAALRAYLAVRPDSDLAPMIVKWIVNNRRGSHWASTKETAMAVYALAEYIRDRRELAPDLRITVSLGDTVARTYRVNRENALFFDNRFIVGDEVLRDGPQTVTIRVEGSGTLYYSAYLKYFSLEEDIKGIGDEISVRRRYFRLTPQLVWKTEEGRRWRELTYDRQELPTGSTLRSGDMIEVELVIEAKNDYEYLVFEDMKPAGCEPVALRSGAGEGAGVCSYMELRDEKVAFFVTRMPQGTRAVRYRVRAEAPGSFHALPTNGYAMYAPDVRCLSDEWRVRISD